jgi:hypothetical protein
MTKSKPIEKWKFDLQIIFAIILILVYCTRGVLFVLYDAYNTKINLINSNLWYVTTLLNFIILGFQIRLFQPIKAIKSLAKVCMFIYSFGVTYDLVKRMIPFERDLFQILHFFNTAIDIASMVIFLILFINMLRKKFEAISVIKLLRSYAIVQICATLAVFLMPSTIYLFPPTRPFIFWQWGLNYFLLALPLVFLIVAYVKIKSAKLELTPIIEESR